MTSPGGSPGPILLPGEFAIGELDLVDVADCVLISDWAGSFFNDGGNRIPGRDGILFDPLAPWAELIFMLTTWVRLTDESGSCQVDHGDGRWGHMFENLSKIKLALNPGLVTLYAAFPHLGPVQSLVKSVTKPVQLNPQYRSFQWMLTSPAGSWQSQTLQSATGNPPAVTTGGDRTIYDPIIILSAAGTFQLTAADGTVYLITGAAGPTYPVTINVGAGTVFDSAGTPADARGDVTFTHQQWCRLSPGAAQVIATSVPCTVQWRDRWS
jgi:hypothetical protein